MGKIKLANEMLEEAVTIKNFKLSMKRGMSKDQAVKALKDLQSKISKLDKIMIVWMFDDKMEKTIEIEFQPK